MSRLIRNIITPIQDITTIDTVISMNSEILSSDGSEISFMKKEINSLAELLSGLIPYIKNVGLFDIDDRDEIIPYMILASISRIERLTSLVLFPSNVQSNYRQEKGGSRIEMFFCNGLDTSTLPDYNFSGIDGGYFIELQGQQDINISYQAGFETLPEWAKLAIAKDVVWHLENQGSEQVDNISPQSFAIIAPFRRTLHEFIL